VEALGFFLIAEAEPDVLLLLFVEPLGRPGLDFEAEVEVEAVGRGGLKGFGGIVCSLASRLLRRCVWAALESSTFFSFALSWATIGCGEMRGLDGGVGTLCVCGLLVGSGW
jgi:hypothetical protein